MKKLSLIIFLTLCTLFAKAQQSILPSSCNELFIAGYMDGTGYDKAIALFNPSDAPINLSDYDVRIYDNGSSTISHSITFSSINVLPHSSFIITNDQFNSTYIGYTNWNTANCFFKGNDAVELTYMTSPIDRIGRVGEDSLWVVDSTSNTQLHTLLRTYSTTEGEINWDDARGTYEAFGSNDYMDLISRTSQWCSSSSSNDAQFLNDSTWLCEKYGDTIFIPITTATPPSVGNTKTVQIYFSGNQPPIGGWATFGTHFTCANNFYANIFGVDFYSVSFDGSGTHPGVAYVMVNMVQTTSIEATSAINPTIENTTAPPLVKSFYLFRIDQFEILTDCDDWMTTGINSAKRQEDITIYPIPATNELNIATGNSSIKQITITNILGETQLVNNTFTKQHDVSLNIQNLPKGNYFITIQLENKNVIYKLFTKF